MIHYLYLTRHLLILLLQLSDHLIQSFHNVGKGIVVVFAPIISAFDIVSRVDVLAPCRDNHGGACTFY